MKVKNTIKNTSEENFVQAFQENTGIIFFHLLNAKSYAPNDTLEALEGR